MYSFFRRSKFDPLWTTFVVGGIQDGKPFLGYVDKLGTAYEDDTVATGYGNYLARVIELKLEINFLIHGKFSLSPLWEKNSRGTLK